MTVEKRDHFDEALHHLSRLRGSGVGVSNPDRIAIAQVHATLALAEALMPDADPDMRASGSLVLEDSTLRYVVDGKATGYLIRVFQEGFAKSDLPGFSGQVQRGLDAVLAVLQA